MRWPVIVYGIRHQPSTTSLGLHQAPRAALTFPTYVPQTNDSCHINPLACHLRKARFRLLCHCNKPPVVKSVQVSPRERVSLAPRGTERSSVAEASRNDWAWVCGKVNMERDTEPRSQNSESNRSVRNNTRVSKAYSRQCKWCTTAKRQWSLLVWGPRLNCLLVSLRCLQAEHQACSYFLLSASFLFFGSSKFIG